MSTDGGYIALHRKILQWEWYDDNNVFRVFIHCLLRANHKDNNWRGQVIKRGQFISSRGKLAQELKLGEQQVRTALNKLKATNEVTSVGKSQHTVFTVINYDLYQTPNQQSNQHLTNEQPASNQQVTTNNNVNNENNEKKDTASKKLNFSSWGIEPGEEFVSDWKKARKAKRLAPPSQSIINRIGKEFAKAADAGFTAEQCIDQMSLKSWASFEAAWMSNANVVALSTVTTPSRPKPMPMAGTIK